MLNSGTRKRALSGWLNEHQTEEFSSALKLQKFLFFYESYSKIDGDPETDFYSLKGYENGPVFSNVYGDYTHRKEDFIYGSQLTYESQVCDIDQDRAKFSGFLVKILNERELSDITHELNIWNSKKRLITAGVRHVSLNQNDFNEADKELLTSLRDMYSLEYIDSVDVITIGQKAFIIDKKDKAKLTDEQLGVFMNLANDTNLENPVYVSLSEDGVILVD